MLNKIFTAIDAHQDEMIAIRRYLHQYPELSFHEYKTAAYIANFYEELQIPYQTNVGGNGLIATLKGGKPGKTVALRADFDALPIQDEKNVPYKSKNAGVMHACGHDGHTATLLVLAKVMKKFQAELAGTIVFLHQHAEEIMPGGAKSILDTGALADVEAVFGNHLWATTPLGTLQTCPGAFMAGADKFEVTIKGKGGHGAYPQETKDALLIGAEAVTQLQNIISRRISPLETAVITIGEFNAGTSFNVIADKATFVGTVRYLDPAVQEKVKKEIKAVLHGVCASYQADCELNYIDGYPPVINHEADVAILFEASDKIPEITKKQISEPQMGGEDFAYYLQEKRGAFFFTGAMKEGHAYPHHHPMFDIDEASLAIAAKTLISAYLGYQEKA